MEPPIYLDHHATTRLAPEAAAAMRRALDEGLPGNPSSVHAAGRQARRRIEDARHALAEVIGATPREIVFTSGGTEAVHLGVAGVGEAIRASRVVCDPGAHPCLRAACEALAASVGAPFSWLPTRAGGDVDDDAFAESITSGALVAVTLVQHETGAVTRWRAVRDACARVKATLVIDAVQALGKVPLDVGVTGAAAVAFSAHKIGGPTGVGALWLAAGARVVQRVRGGGQERGVRAGTENMLGVVGFGAAASTVARRLAAMSAVARRRDVIERAVLSSGDALVNGIERERVATASHVSIRGLSGQELVAALDLEGFCVSSGAACSSGRAEPSESLLRLYPGEAWRAEGALRVTLAPDTTDAEAERAAEVIPALIARVRSER